MLKIMGRNTSLNVQKVLWCCEELGLAFEREDIGGQYGGNREPQYLAMNPNGLVPTIIDDGFVLWESNSIIRYLAGKYGHDSFHPADLETRAKAERWMDWHLSVAHPSHRPVFVTLLHEPERRDDPELAEAIGKWTDAMRILDAALKDSDFVVGDHLTIGDIPLGLVVYRWFNLDMNRAELPDLAAWYDRLSQREGYRKHVRIAPA